MKLLALAIVAVFALPAVAALPAVCGPDCRINASSFPGYDPLVALIASGTSVTWHSTDTTHLTRDTSVSGAEPCLEVVHERGADSPSVRFDLVEETLFATTEGVTLECGNATATSAGAALNYFCVLHPLMRAALVVTT